MAGQDDTLAPALHKADDPSLQLRYGAFGVRPNPERMEAPWPEGQHVPHDPDDPAFVRLPGVSNQEGEKRCRAARCHDLADPNGPREHVDRSEPELGKGCDQESERRDAEEDASVPSGVRDGASGGDTAVHRDRGTVRLVALSSRGIGPDGERRLAALRTSEFEAATPNEPHQEARSGRHQGEAPHADG